MQRWEYTTVKHGTGGFLGGVVDVERLEKDLNRLGRDGWELVSCFTAAENLGASREVVAILKRARPPTGP